MGIVHAIIRMSSSGDRQKSVDMMKTQNLSKLLFAGVAVGIALSGAIVLTTAVSSISEPVSVSETKTDRLVVEAGSDPKSDRVSSGAEHQQVVRDGKSDALEITLAILRGSDITPSDPLPFPDALETAEIDIEADTETAIVAPVKETIKTPVAAPTVKVVTSRAEPVNIIPVPAPVENTPVSAPTTTTNFTTEPAAVSSDIGIRPDLAR